jgi:excisionase family DNA binding protein
MRNGSRQRQINEDALTISVEECAKALGISKVSAYAAVKRGDLPTVRIGRRILVPRRALEEMLEVAALNSLAATPGAMPFEPRGRPDGESAGAARGESR